MIIKLNKSPVLCELVGLDRYLDLLRVEDKANGALFKGCL